ncbi:DNA mismatch repair endonuclease MutL [Flavobacterium sp. RHBU_24]|uniref:DNA mismatch repair endonuclease MutL n=1 Tax=Flavobacterium sp. RHBU_24 TaxID=3391185 RepID=UPI003984BE0A
MSSIIQLLPDHVANQIAAGEVVQRPASVVKELLENAVDAGSTEIKLIVKDAGKTLIQVIDNGKGMSVTDSRLCFERHATSKIRHAEDLFALHTKGFRGEALASIAAIAHVELKTRQEQDELGTHLVIEGSKFTSQEVAVLPKGTSFSVKNLFFNIPARRNFLKSDTVEFRHVIDEFERVAMAHHNISFVLYHNGSEMFNLPSGNQRQRIVNIFGGRTNEKLVPVKESTEIVQIGGFVAKPEFAKKSRGEQFFFVNNRFIKSPYLHHAVMAAYEGLLKDGCQPGYYIYMDVPPHTIDINIHPTKTEIKFDDEHALYAILRSTIKHALGQFNIAPVLDFDRDANLDTPYDYEKRDAVIPGVVVDRNYNPFAEESPVKSEGSFASSSGGNSFRGDSYTPSFKKERQPAWESLYVGTSPSREDIADISFESEEVTGSLFNDNEVMEAVQRTYQIHKKYIVSPIKSGMVIIDQKRAHQRILYEQFLRNITVQQASSQQLLFPLVLHYNSGEMAIIREMQEALVNTGFVFAEFNSDHIVVSGLPVNVAESEVSILLEEVINDLQQEVPDSSFSQSDRIAKSMARSLAVRTGTLLTEKEQENMVNALFACKEPDVSPFNKPTFITVSVEDLDKRFAL